MGRRTKRKVLKRSSVPVELWFNFVLAAAFAGLNVFLLILGILRGGGVFSILIPSILATVAVGVMVRIWRVLTRKIVFLDKYISYSGWLRAPKVYQYEDIVDIRTVIIPPGRLSWLAELEFETGVTIIFADGEELRVPTSAMKPYEVRRRIESKTGLRFTSSSTLKL